MFYKRCANKHNIGKTLFTKTTLMLMIIALLSGCAVGPNFQRPQVTLAREWQNTADKRLIKQPGDYRNWWKAFNDPVLDNLIDKA